MKNLGDIYTKEKRSDIMSKVKAKNTKPELQVRSWLHQHGFRFRLHAKDLPGIPDIVLPKYKTVIFVHGCFWHQHPGCKKATIPKNNYEFWKPKLDGNVVRDNRNIEDLKEMGWKVITVWECAIKKDADQNMRIIEALIRQSK